jgi:IMP dehydrogenase
MTYKVAYTFDDLMLVPTYSEVPSRHAPSTKTNVGQVLEIPIISAPMTTVTEKNMAEAMAEMGADAVLHRYMSIEEQVVMYLDVQAPHKPWVAIGASGDFLERASALNDVGVRKFCIDVANGHSRACFGAVEKIRETYPNCHIMAGNVCSGPGAYNLEQAGANVIRVGIGPGSVCQTRLVTGFGIPQLSAIKWCSEAVLFPETAIVADGGIRSSGDLVKAIAIGANAVMLGGMLAGADQCPGSTVRDPETGRLYKHIHGMASEEGRRQYFKSNEDVAFVPEGISTRVWHKGDVKKIVKNMNDSLKVGMSFANAMTISELQNNAQWVQVTPNGNVEGNPNRKMYK